MATALGVGVGLEQTGVGEPSKFRVGAASDAVRPIIGARSARERKLCAAGVESSVT